MGGINMSGYDVVIAAIFVFFMARGLWVGFLRQLTVVIALYVSYVVAGGYHDRLFPFMRGFSENRQVVFLLDYAVLFACTYVLVMLAGKALAYVVQLTIAGWFDRVLGALFGGIKALFIVVLAHMAVTLVLDADSPVLKKSQLSPYLSQVMGRFQKVVEDEKLLEAMKKKGPAIPGGMLPPVPALKKESSSVTPQNAPPSGQVDPAAAGGSSAPVPPAAEQGSKPAAPVQ